MVPLAVVFVATSLSGGTVSRPAPLAVQSSVQVAAVTSESPATPKTDAPSSGAYVDQQERIPTQKKLVLYPLLGASAVLTVGMVAWMVTAGDRREAVNDYESAHNGLGINLCATNGAECQEYRTLRDARDRAKTAWLIWGGGAAITAGAAIVTALIWPNKWEPVNTKPSARITPTLGGLQIDGVF